MDERFSCLRIRFHYVVTLASLESYLVWQHHLVAWALWLSCCHSYGWRELLESRDKRIHPGDEYTNVVEFRGHSLLHDAHIPDHFSNVTCEMSSFLVCAFMFGSSQYLRGLYCGYRWYYPLRSRRYIHLVTYNLQYMHLVTYQAAFHSEVTKIMSVIWRTDDKK